MSKKHTAAEVKVEQEAKPPLGERLQKIREEIVASGIPSLTAQEIEREVLERRGGYQELE